MKSTHEVRQAISRKGNAVRSHDATAVAQADRELAAAWLIVALERGRAAGLTDWDIEVVRRVGRLPAYPGEFPVPEAVAS